LLTQQLQRTRRRSSAVDLDRLDSVAQNLQEV
jgi:hypothetical protein